ncbi:MAG: tRNA (guanosine(46)-N7)-methyltransferase TrmB [Ginsengibacter sp.]
MGQKKLKRFSEIKTFKNVFEYPETMPGRWHSFFNNENEIILELACGKGEYTIGLAKIHPDKNFIGIDIKGNRMWVGAKYALDNGLGNAAFLRTQIVRVHEYFNENEVDEIWITFPDPQLRFSKAKKRLTHPRFLRLYQKILKPGGKIHLKTDSPDLYQFTKKVIELYHLSIISDCDDVYGQDSVSEELKIKTHYEGLDIAKSNRIFYLYFTMPQNLSDDEGELNEYLKNSEQNKDEIL